MEPEKPKKAYTKPALSEKRTPILPDSQGESRSRPVIDEIADVAPVVNANVPLRRCMSAGE